MRVAVVLVVCALAFASAAPLLSEENYQFLFTKWVSQYNKEYEHDHFFARYNTFKANMDRINAHNEGNHSYTMAMNEFGDMSFEEFHAKYTGYKPVANNFLRSLNAPEETKVAVADSLDWVAKGAVTPVKNQGQCGSCWSFSATGSIEGANFIKNGKLVSVSEQQLVDCAGAQGNDGCNGGLMDNAFEFVIANGGLCTEAAYPYTAVDGSCSKSCTPAVTISGYKDVAAGSESGLMSAIQLGPVSVAIEADQSGFQFYSGGVFDGPCGTNLDHGVLLVAYGTDSGKDYWTIKNSWGASWGENGYIRFTRNKNMCGLANVASYPIA